jgi:hypothetical protein
VHEAPLLQEAAAAALANLAANSGEAQSLIASAGETESYTGGHRGSRGLPWGSTVCFITFNLGSLPAQCVWRCSSPLPCLSLCCRCFIKISVWPLTCAGAGAIPLLVEVLRCGTLPAKQHAARAIRNLGGCAARLLACSCCVCLTFRYLPIKRAVLASTFPVSSAGLPGHPAPRFISL